MNKITNPFPVTGYAGPEYFCNRKEETKRLAESLASGRHTVLLSVRRMGKTALLRHLFHQIPSKKAFCLYCDIENTLCRNDLINVLATSIWQALPENSSWSSKMLRFLKSLRPIVTYDEMTGLPEVKITLSTDKQEENTVQQLISILQNQPCPVYFAIDEFQQIASYPEKNTEALLRSIIQSLNGVSFIFSGSQQHILTDMFGSAKKPFFGMTEMLKLKKINRNIYSDFIKKKFLKSSFIIEQNALNLILDWTMCHTSYTQHLCNRLFANARKKIDEGMVRMSCAQILQEQETEFFTYRNMLTDVQWRLLIAIASEEKLIAPTKGKFISAYSLGAPSSVFRAIESLLDKELIYKDYEEKGTPYYSVYNVFFSHWLKKLKP